MKINYKISSDNLEIFLAISTLFLFIIGVITSNINILYSNIIFLLSVIVGGSHLLKEGIEELIKDKHFNVDLLMIIASIGAMGIGDYREGSLLIFIFSLSHALEEYTTNKSKKEIESLINIQPNVAKKLINGKYTEVSVDKLYVGDTISVLKGESVPIDGKIISGTSIFNESVINGESIPKEKTIGDEIFGGTINLGNEVTVSVTKTSSETVFANIIKLVKEAQNSKTKTESFIQRVENKYVLSILIGVPLAILFFNFVLNWGWNESLYRGVNLLVVASPCALVASSSPALLSAISNGARNGVLFKSGKYLEDLSEIKSISFDKTGTLTKGKPVVTDYWFENNEKEYMAIIKYMESKSTHPIASAIKNKFIIEKNYKTKVNELTAVGLETTINNKVYTLGKAKDNFHNEETLLWENQGKTVIYLTEDSKVVGAIAVLDEISDNSKQAVEYFNKEGINTVMLTGDSEQTARYIAENLKINEYHARLFPDGKVEHIKKQNKIYGKTAMVGDGINDAPSLATANLGIGMGQGTDVAKDVADLVIMENDLNKLVYTYKLSKRMKKIIKQNIIFSISIIVFLILVNVFQVLTISSAVIGHEMSTILVILNSLRLLK